MKRSQFILSFLAVAATAFWTACTSITKIEDGRHHMLGKENIRTPEMMFETYKVAGNCDMCKQRIETAAKNMKGVTEAHWNVENKALKVMYFPQQTNGLAIQKAISAVGHDTEKYKSENTIYKELPSCCLYERQLQ